MNSRLDTSPISTLLMDMVKVFGISLSQLLEVLVVPITVAAAVPVLNWLQEKRELAIGNQRAQDEALQAYLDQMSQLLLDKDRPLLMSKTDSEESTNGASTLAKARTQTVLTRLDSRRKRSVVDFLYESCLIRKYCKGLGDWPLNEANLIEADLFKAHLSGRRGQRQP